MNRTKGIIAAGGLTGLVLLTLLALGWAGRIDNAQAAEPPALPDTATLSDQDALQAWQDYATELEATVRTMQGREGTYQTQLEAANATIQDLEAQINSGGSGGSYYDDDDDDRYEEDDDDHERYEREDDDDDDDDHERWEHDDD